MKFQIDKPQRYAKMRAHTATHLLHSEITKIINNTKQAGSFVDKDYLRFDFQSKNQLSFNEIKNIEKNINNCIYKALPVTTQELPIKEAKKIGAKAFFGDKYGNIVRVVSIKENGQNISIELCGGTHINNTKEIGAFKIISQEAVASGIKRIIAITGPKVVEYFQKEEENIQNLAQKLGVTNKQLPNKLEKIIKEYSLLQDKYNSLQNKLINQNLKNLYNSSKGNKKFYKIIKINNNSELGNINFKLISQYAKKISDKTILIYNDEGNFIIIAEEGKSAKSISQKLNLKGGGNDKIIQGKDKNINTIF